jgi:tetratricopeptide (TPR) repeat protein
LAQLQQLAAKNPGVKGLSHELGTAYYKKGDFIRAIESFKDALQQDPQDNEAVQLLGLSYYLSGRPAHAIPHLERVQAWYPQANVDASYILGLCYIQTKDYPQARKAFPRRPLSFRRNWRSIPAMPPAITNSRTPTTTHGRELS